MSGIIAMRRRLTRATTPSPCVVSDHSASMGESKWLINASTRWSMSPLPTCPVHSISLSGNRAVPTLRIRSKAVRCRCGRRQVSRVSMSESTRSSRPIYVPAKQIAKRYRMHDNAATRLGGGGRPAWRSATSPPSASRSESLLRVITPSG